MATTETGETGPPSQTRSRKRLCLGAAIFALTILAGAALVVQVRRGSPAQKLDPHTLRVPPDPRLSYQGPFANVHPAVKYVGSAQCGECHAKIADVYARHPMARTLIPIADL